MTTPNDLPSVGTEELPEWEHPWVQVAYKILCSDAKPPEGEHWEGFVARRITAALVSERDELASRVSELEGAVSEFLEMVEEPPESNCSCHISPPCGDCVDHSGARSAFAAARAALASKEQP